AGGVEDGNAEVRLMEIAVRAADEAAAVTNWRGAAGGAGNGDGAVVIRAGSVTGGGERDIKSLDDHGDRVGQGAAEAGIEAGPARKGEGEQIGLAGLDVPM